MQMNDEQTEAVRDAAANDGHDEHRAADEPTPGIRSHYVADRPSFGRQQPHASYHLARPLCCHVVRVVAGASLGISHTSSSSRSAVHSISR